MNSASGSILSDLPGPPAGRRGWPWTESSPPLPPRMPDGTPWPRITMVTPSLNQAKWLEQTLRSVLLQGYPDLEYFVVDGGSTDGSVEIIRRYERWLTGWVSEPDRGQSHAINKGLARATGEALGWINSDDFLLPRALERLMLLRKAHPEAVAWAGALRSITADGRHLATATPVMHTRDEIAVASEGQIRQPSCLFSREAFLRAGGLSEDLHFTMDLDLWLRLAQFGPFATTPDVVASDTHHAAAKTISQAGKGWAEVAIVRIRNGYEQIAREQLGRELQELAEFRSRSLAFRAKYALNMFLRPLREGLRRKKRAD